MRNLSSAVLTALSLRTLQLRWFFSITAVDRSTGNKVSAFYWTGIGSLFASLIDGFGIGALRTYLGTGTLITCSPIVLTNDLSVRTVVVTLSQTNDAIDTYVRGYDLRNAYVEIHLGIFNPLDNQLVDSILPMFAGKVDGATIKTPTPGQAGSIELSCVSATRELTRASTAVRSYEDQLKRDPADQFYIYSAAMASLILFWGEQKAGIGNTVVSSARIVQALTPGFR